MSKELQKQRMPNEVHPGRSVKSIVSKYLVAGATLLTLGCGGAQVGSNTVASLVNIPVGGGNKGAYVTPDANKIAETEKKTEKKEEKKTEISINELKGYQLKFKEKQGAYYELVSETDERFYVEVAMKKLIYLEGGKKALDATAKISINEVKKEGEDSSYIFMQLIDVEQNKLITAWSPNFDDLAKEYKEMTGKELKYVHVIVEHDGKGKDEYIQFYIIPASSLKSVEKGIIESGMPIYTVQIAPNSENGKWECGTVKTLVTAP